MTHLTHNQRYTISCMISQGYKQKDIALSIGKDKSVVSRELARNSDKRNRVYKADLATKKYNQRQREQPKHIRFTQDMKDLVICYLREDYSPEQVVGKLHKLDIDCVSSERIYQYIWHDKKNKGNLYTHLRRQGRKYRKRGSLKDNRGIIKDRVGIEKRPKIVDERVRFGDLEVDLIIGKNHNQAMVTINDRASGMVKIGKVISKDASIVSNKIIALLEDCKPYIQTITSDNGKEFAKHKIVSKNLNIDYYFARPYHSWERGSNENLNGLIRQYFKKGSDFSAITDKRIIEIQNKINNRPRKRFKFESPIFVMENLLFNQKVAFVT